jgi:hypothetical protein
VGSTLMPVMQTIVSERGIARVKKQSFRSSAPRPGQVTAKAPRASVALTMSSSVFNSLFHLMQNFDDDVQSSLRDLAFD